MSTASRRGESGADVSREDDIAAVVVSHQSAETIDDCLHRLRTAAGVGAIRVVDNASTDGTLEIVQRHAASDPRLRFIANPDNPGFAVACNQGAFDCDAPWLAFVNPDCLVESDSLARLRAHAWALERERALAPGAGGGLLLGADLANEDGIRDGAARRRDPDFAAMLRGPAARRLEIPRDEAAVLQAVPAVSGALMFLPRSLFERIGGFDESYRLHAEDLDLCRRARADGAAVAVANDVPVTHIRGVSSRARPLFVEWHKHRGLARYFAKFEAPHRSAPVRLAVYAMIWAHFVPAAWRAKFGRRGTGA